MGQNRPGWVDLLTLFIGVRENERKETRTSTSEVVQRAKKPNARQRAEPSTTNEGACRTFSPPMSYLWACKTCFSQVLRHRLHP
ncbi:hypothetical protein Hanom_Chr14g01284751 [Helianthus anomalus]